MNDPLTALKYLFLEFMDEHEQDVTKAIFCVQGCEVLAAGQDGNDSFYIDFKNKNRNRSFRLSISDSKSLSVKVGEIPENE